MKVHAKVLASLSVLALSTSIATLHAEEKLSSSSVAPKQEHAALSLWGSQALPAGSGVGPRVSFPRAELFLGYSYLRAVPTFADGNRLVFLHGGSTSLALNLNRYLGLVGDVGGYNANSLNLTGPGANPAGVAAAGGTAYTYLFGPRLSFRNHERFTPFAQALFGAVHAGAVTLSNCTAAPCTPLPSQNAFALTAGGGLDLNVYRHLALRLFQAEYLMTRFADPVSQVKSTQNDIRLSTGLVLQMGGTTPQAPVSYDCSANPTSVYAGDPVTITGNALNLNPKRPTTYTWSADNGSIASTSSVASINTTGFAPGTFSARGHVSNGTKPGRSADCAASYTVKSFDPPTISCSPASSTALPGDAVIITSTGNSPQNRPLTYSYQTSAGTVTGDTAQATLRTVPASTGDVRITCNVSDDKGKTASTTTSVTLQPMAVPVAATTSSLCSITFTRDLKRPTRVDNEAKACLDDVALNLQRASDSRLAVVGNSAVQDGTRSANTNAAQRAVNAREYLVTEKGIDPSRVTVFIGTDASDSVGMILIPTGASLDMSNKTPVDESVKPISRTSKRVKQHER